MKVYEWLFENVASHHLYDAKKMSEFLKEKTGVDCQFEGLPAEVHNQSVGQHKGLLAPVIPDYPDQRFIEGWKIPLQLCDCLGIDDKTGQFFGRGTIHAHAIDQIRNANK